jgi:uncharacterized membrane protein YhaH (DUF805 family)
MNMDWRYLLLSMDGRITRRSFWLTILAIAVVSVIVRIIDAIIHSPTYYGTGILGILLGVALIYPAIALYAKRWHDRNKSGWWSLIALIPIIGGIWLLVELGFLRGTVGPNSYGPDPLQG